MKASGHFEVDLKPIDNYAQGANGLQLARMSIDKQFSGDLTATSQGEMLSARTSVAGSAGYVALEQVQGTLHGKQGSFALQHFGKMAQGDGSLVIEIVPDSGTGQLSGLSGTMSISMKDGKHAYELEYEFSQSVYGS